MSRKALTEGYAKLSETKLRSALTLLRFWENDCADCVVIMPTFSPKEAFEMASLGKISVSREAPDEMDGSVRFTGDEYARDFILGVLEHVPGLNEVRTLSSRFVESKDDADEFLAKQNVILIGSPRSNEITARAMRLLYESGLEVPGVLPDAGADGLVWPIVAQDGLSCLPETRGEGAELRWYRDYGYAARFPNPWAKKLGQQTDAHLVIVAGAGPFGTQGAAAALTIDRSLSDLMQNFDDDADVIKGIIQIQPKTRDRENGKPLSHALDKFEVSWVQPVSAGPYQNPQHHKDSLRILNQIRDEEALWRTAYVRHLQGKRKQAALKQTGSRLLFVFCLICAVGVVAGGDSSYPLLSLLSEVPWPVWVFGSILSLEKSSHYGRCKRAMDLVKS